MKRALKLNRSVITKMNDQAMSGVAGGPGHGQSNRCVPYSYMTYCAGHCGQDTEFWNCNTSGTSGYC